MYRNKITITETEFIKEFSQRANFLTELIGIEAFSQTWDVPKITQISPMKIRYKRIYRKNLADKIQQVTVKDIKRFLDKTKCIGFSDNFGMEVYDSLLERLPNAFIAKVRLEPETLVHGDFRPYIDNSDDCSNIYKL